MIRHPCSEYRQIGITFQVRELAAFMENYEFLRKKKEILRGEVYQLVDHTP
jgi:hypothetical protein